MSALDVGFVGLGHMGGAMAGRLLDAGYQLAVHDLDPEAAAPFVTRGARRVEDVVDLAAAAKVVFLCLPSAEASLAVAKQLSASGALSVLIETSTVGPATVHQLAAEMVVHDIAVVDAPVSGGPRAAAAGALAMMYAGEADAVAFVLPYLEAIAPRLTYVGAEPGLAQVCKLANNAISAAGMVAACEATVVGAKAGLDPEVMLAAITAGSGRNSATLDKFPAAILPGTFDFGGPMGLMLKDLSLFIDEAQACGASAILAPVVLDAWREAVRVNGADADYSKVIRHFEIAAGVDVRARPQRES